MPTVNIQGVGAVNFPDSMSEYDIRSAIERDILPNRAAPASAESAARTEGADFVRNSVYGGPVGSLNAAAQGLTFGFSDEIGGALNALRSPSSFVESYKSSRDYLRGMGEQHAKDYPVANAIGNVGGSMAWGGPAKAVMGAIGPGTSTLGTLGKAALGGGVLGAAGGAGIAENMESIPLEMAKGGAQGAALGGAFQGVGTGIRGTYNAVMPNFSGAAARTAAQQRVANALTQDERTGSQVLARMSTLGDEARIADSAGKSTANLLDTMSTLPGKTQNQAEALIRTRRATAPNRLDTISTELSGGARAAPTYDALQAIKEAQSKPLYDAVRNRVVPITPKLESLMERPAFREAFDQAVTTEANFGRQMQTLEDLLASAPAAGVKVGFWDSVKRGLDDVIAAKKRGLSVDAPSNKNRAQSTLQSSLDIKRELVAEVDELTGGAYAAARNAYAGPAAMQSALLEGRGVWKMPTDEVRSTLAQMSNSERDAFRIGAGETMRELAGSPTGQTRLLNAWKDRTLREKLQAIYGNEASYRRALTALMREERLRRLEGNVGRGSQTAGRDARIESENLGLVTDAAQAARSGSFSGVLDVARKTYGRMAMPEPVRNEIGRILMQGGAKGRKEITSIEDILREIQQRNRQEAAFTGLLGGTFAQ